MTKCKFANDPTDSTCKACNGIEFNDGTVMCSCIECESFEPDIPDDEVETPPWEEAQQETAQNAPVTAEKENKVSSKVEPEKAVTAKISSSNGTVQPIPTKICYSSGITVEKGGRYYKLNAMEEWTIPDGCDIEQARKDLWEQVNNMVDDQVDALK